MLRRSDADFFAILRHPMKTLIASTALAAAMITPAAFAGEETYTETETGVAVAADVTLTGFTDDNDWVNKPVFDEEGQPVGEVERVSFNDDGAVSDIVVETGGILEVGGEEILVTESEYTVVVAQGDVPALADEVGVAISTCKSG